MIIMHEPAIQWVSVKTALAPRRIWKIAQQSTYRSRISSKRMPISVYSTDMIERWCRRYKHVPGARDVVKDVVQEWFEQQLIEAVMGAQALRDARQWTFEDVQRLWSE